MKYHYHAKKEGKKTMLSAERQQQLEEIGFDFDTIRRRKPKSWETRFAEFEHYVHEKGHPFVPQHFPGGLGRWVNSQRWKFSNLKSAGKEQGGEEKGDSERSAAKVLPVLSTEQIFLLNKAGFAWSASFMFGTGVQHFEEMEENDQYLLSSSRSTVKD